MHRKPAVFAILVGGAVAGALDITYAIGFTLCRGGTATRLLQTGASGCLRQASHDGGLPTAALGLVTHFSLAITTAAVFYVASRRFEVLLRSPVISGVVYGLGIFAVMNFIVLPLS